MKKSFAKYSMLIGAFYITEVGLQVDITDHSASHFNVDKNTKIGHLGQF